MRATSHAPPETSIATRSVGEGETHIEPPPEARGRQGVLRIGNYWSAEGLRDPRPRLVRPDAILEVARTEGDGSRVFFIVQSGPSLARSAKYSPAEMAAAAMP